MKVVIALLLFASYAQSQPCLPQFGNCQVGDCCDDLVCIDFGTYSQCHPKIAKEWEICANEFQQCESELKCVDFGTYSQCRQVVDVVDEDDEGPLPTTTMEPACFPSYANCHDGEECCGEMLCIDFGYYSQCRNEFA